MAWARAIWTGLADPVRVINVVLAAVPVALLGLLGWQRRWIADDGMIVLRVVENLATGHGMVFNRGERVEASTTTLWVVILWIGRVLTPVDLTTLAVLLGVLFSCGGLALALAGAARLRRRSGLASGALWFPAGAVVLVALPPVWDFATSALETGLTFGWLGLSWWLLTGLLDGQTSAKPVIWPAFLVAGLGPLVRPDFGLYSLAFLFAACALVRTSVTTRLRLLGVAAVAPACYELFRMGYFGSLVPNTALAKSAASVDWNFGWIYVGDYAGRYWLVVPLALVLLLVLGEVRAAASGARARYVWLVLPVVLAATLHAAYVVRIGGDFMHGRMLLPATFAVLMVTATVSVPRSLVDARWIPAVLVSLVVWALLCGTFVRPDAVVEPSGIADERSAYTYLGAAPGFMGEEHYREDPEIALGRDLQAEERAGASFLVDMGTLRRYPGNPGAVTVRLGKIGHVAYGGMELFIADHLSLADPVGARLDLPLPTDGTKRAGHNQRVPLAWHLARYAAPAADDTVQTRAARDALRCGEVAELQAAVAGPMTWSRFWSNVEASVRLTRLSIPEDPVAAREKFCGSR